MLKAEDIVWNVPVQWEESLRYIVAKVARPLTRAREYYVGMSILHDLYKCFADPSKSNLYHTSSHVYLSVRYMIIRYGRNQQSQNMLKQLDTYEIISCTKRTEKYKMSYRIEMQDVSKLETAEFKITERDPELVTHLLNYRRRLERRHLRRAHLKQQDRFISIIDYESLAPNQVFGVDSKRKWNAFKAVLDKRRDWKSYQYQLDGWKHNMPMTREAVGGRHFSTWSSIRRSARARAYDLRTGKRLVEIDVRCAQYAFLADWVRFSQQLRQQVKHANLDLNRYLSEADDLRTVCNHDLYTQVSKIDGFNLDRDHARRAINLFFFRNMNVPTLMSKEPEYKRMAEVLSNRWPTVLKVLGLELWRHRNLGLNEFIRRKQNDQLSYHARRKEADFMFEFSSMFRTYRRHAAFIWIHDALYVSAEHADACIELLENRTLKLHDHEGIPLWCFSFRAHRPVPGTLDRYYAPEVYGVRNSFSSALF